MSGSKISNLETIISTMADTIKNEGLDNSPSTGHLRTSPVNGNSIPVLQQKHDNLMRENQTIHQDLDVALEIVNKLRTENEGLKENFETLKSSFVNLQQKHSQISQNFESTAKEKALIEDKFENSMLEWKTLLETKDREIANAKAEIMLPQDMELLRLKIIEEIEVNNDKKWQTVNQEIEKYRGLYFQTRRELELNLTEIDRTRNECNAKLTEQQISHETEIHALESRIFDLQNLVDEMDQEDRTKKLAQENIELQAKVSELVSELEEVRANKENKAKESESSSRLNSRIIDEQKAQFSNLENEKTALFNKANRLELDLQQTSKQYEQVLEDNGKLNKEIARLTSRQEESLHQFNVEASNLKLIFAKEKSNMEQINNSLSHKYEEYKSLYEQSEGTITEMRMKIQETEKEVYAKIRQAREEEIKKFNNLETEKRELELKIQDLKAKLIEENHLQDSYSKENQIVVNRLKDEIRRFDVDLHKQKIISEKLSDENESLKLQVSKLEENHRADIEKSSKLVAKIENLRMKENQLKENMQGLEVRLADVTRQASKMRSDLEKERAAFQITIKRLKGSHAKINQTYDQKIETLTNNLEQSKKDLDSIVSYTKKYKLKHKTRQEILANQYTDLRSVNQKQEIEISSLKKALEAVSNRTSNQLQELSRRHEEFKNFLQKETEHARGNNNMSQETVQRSNSRNYGRSKTVAGNHVIIEENVTKNPTERTNYKVTSASVPPLMQDPRMDDYVTYTALRYSTSVNSNTQTDRAIDQSEGETSVNPNIQVFVAPESTGKLVGDSETTGPFEKMEDFHSIMTPSPTRDLSTTPGLSEPIGSSEGSHQLAAFPLSLKS